MINRLSISTILVTDLNAALQFYTEKLGFEIRTDISNYGYRWLTVGLQDQPDIEFHLSELKPGGVYTEEDVAQLTRLVEAGKMGSGPWKTDDCRGTYEAMKSKGVEFVQPPTDQPYGSIEAVFKDNSGNIMVLSQDKA